MRNSQWRNPAALDVSRMMLAPSSSLLLASKTPKVCFLVLLDVSRENVWWMRWNGAESWLPKQINVLGTTFVKDSRWFGWWKVVKIEDQIGQPTLGVRALQVGVRTDGTSGQILESFVERVLDPFSQSSVNDCFQLPSATFLLSPLHYFSFFSAWEPSLPCLHSSIVKSPFKACLHLRKRWTPNST